VGQDNLTADQKQVLGLGEEDQEKIHSYEDAFRKIKEATGVSDTQVWNRMCKNKLNKNVKHLVLIREYKK